CLGKNYAEHAAEFAAFNNDADVIPKAPIIFTKAASALCGPTDNIVVDAALANALDYETELAVIIGKTGRGIPAEEAGEYIAGYTVINDLTARDLQAKHAQWFLAKSLPAASPLGPVVVTPEELTPRGEQQLSTLVNGELRQSAKLAQMITSIETAIETISGIVGLEAGDIIAMGTPSGVAVSFDPPKYLVSGDQVRSEISGIGALANQVIVAG
ncbi:MAG: fumarylacetoacetate hydrolase family protein, partial [Actinomycetota bacterium]|nr:fumarylacetoacetate hydrolase family protein [Actinomycetota bacterium]